MTAPKPPRGAIRPSATPPPRPPEPPQPVIVSSVALSGTVNACDAQQPPNFIVPGMPPAIVLGVHDTTMPPSPGLPFITTTFEVTGDQNDVPAPPPPPPPPLPPPCAP